MRDDKISKELLKFLSKSKRISSTTFIAPDVFSEIKNKMVSANLLRFHGATRDWLEKAYLPNWSIELKTLFAS